MAISNPNQINDLVGLFETIGSITLTNGIVTQNNIGSGGTPADVNFWTDQKLVAPPGNILQSVEAKMPAFKLLATPNNKPSVSFDGSDDLLRTLSSFFFLGSHTIALVVKFPPVLPLSPVTIAHVIGFGLGGEVLRITPAGGLELQDEAGTSAAVSVLVGSGWTLNTWSIVLWTINPFAGPPDELAVLRIDGIPAGSGFFGGFGVDPPSGLSLGSFKTGTQSSDVEVAAVVIYKRILSAIEIGDLENFLTDKYFVIVPPPPPPPPLPPPVLPPTSGKGLKRKAFRYTDLDLDFAPNPVTGAVQRKVDDEAVKRSVRNLMFLNRYEKPFHPEVHSGLRGLLFELVTPAMAIILQRKIIEILTVYEPRAEIIGVNVTDRHEENRYDVEIEFRVLNRDEPVNLVLSLERLR